jgi:hypothetical protein
MIIGGLIARMERVEADVQEIKRFQAETLQILHSAQGGWKTMVIIGTIGAAIGGGVMTLITWAASVKGFR